MGHLKEDKEAFEGIMQKDVGYIVFFSQYPNGRVEF